MTSGRTQQPDEDARAVAGYHLYLVRGCEDGGDVNDWLTAEAALVELPTSKPLVKESPIQEAALS